MTFFACMAMLFTACSDDDKTSEYAITLTANNDGTVSTNIGGTVDAEKAKAGDAITLTATAADGYKFSRWVVTSANLTLEDATANPLTFTMPASNVAIRAEFAEENYTVYIAGSDYDGSKHYPCIWVDGVKQRLPSAGISTAAYAVYVSDNKVYVAGDDREATGKVACLWVDGVKQVLPSNGTDATANSVFVSDGKVYVAGCDLDQPCLWVDGVKQTLPTTVAMPGSQAYKVSVLDGKVYVVGDAYDGAVWRAYLWVDGVAQVLPSSSALSASAISVSVVDDKVYVVGEESDMYTAIACLWVDGVKEELDSDGWAVAYSGYASNNKFYIAGGTTSTSGYNPCLWVDGVRQMLPVEGTFYSAVATDVCVAGGKVYAVGEIEVNSHSVSACLWVDGVKQDLPSEQRAYTYSIFVTPAQ